MTKETAMSRVLEAAEDLTQAEAEVLGLRARLADTCKDAYKAGWNDRQIAEEIGYSRARVQQFRRGSK